MDFQFTTEYAPSRLEEIVAYLLGPRLWIAKTDYPDFTDWAERAYTDLKKETKRALVAFKSNEIVGATIYQRHKQRPDTLELKNITVRPDQRGRYIASFLLRNTEIEGQQDFNSNAIVVDAKAKNFGVRTFFLKHRYEILAKTDLYQLGAGEDIVFRKNLEGLEKRHRFIYT